MKFEEVPSGSYLIKGNTVIDKEEWDTLPTKEKVGWYLAERRRVKVEALKVINHIIDDMVEQGYDDMDIILQENIGDEQIAKMQSVLDELFDNSAADVFHPVKLVGLDE
ncbi:hypothetical protein [Streptococcus hyointestinalis]|uniref:hypothetical protein n=1 Tax=Streptococcus hyointestinalis TaxID=1337 RepID=UPI003F0E747F